MLINLKASHLKSRNVATKTQSLCVDQAVNSGKKISLTIIEK
jgi:hypothetical protein